MTDHEREENRPEGEEELDQQEEPSLEEELFLSPDDDGGVVIELETDDSAEAELFLNESSEGGEEEAESVEEEEEEDEEEDDAEDLSAARIQELEEELAAARKEKEEISDRLLRAAADLENFRRRSEREKQELRKYGSDKVVSELLPAVDNMERALQHANERDIDEESSLVEGIQMVYRQILAALKKHGVEGFESKGEPFDPTRHEAIQQVESTEIDTGIIVEQYQKGYFLHERLLRPALVAVAKRVQPPDNEGSTDESEEEPEPPSVEDSSEERSVDE